MTSVDPQTLLAILVMAAATMFNRASGFFLMRLVPLTPRVHKILDCLPGAVLVAIVAPTAVHGDLAMAAGLLAAFVVTRLTRSDFFAVLAAVAVAAGWRAFGS
ncbi:AzlD family protein [Azorhizobium doebereinerae]|uniref:AzlD family protein n=1 Tax=Azorhizobium doebereinerae TaxID=281091 RepID=UPI00041A2DE8|nr:AzlD domain-containing protein [Azorhizobium doebereinerae]